MKVSKDKSLRKIKTENFLLISTAVVSGSALAFLLCWTVPVASLFSAKRTFKFQNGNNEKYWDSYVRDYNTRICELSRIPFDAYQECKKRANQRLCDYNQKQKS